AASPRRPPLEQIPNRGAARPPNPRSTGSPHARFARGVLPGHVAWVAALALSCRGAPGASAEAAAELFLDKFYLELAPEQALAVTAGPAEAAVRETIRLRDENGRGGAELSQVRPRIYWERLGQERKDDTAVLRYRLRIDSGGASMLREVAVAVA